MNELSSSQPHARRVTQAVEDDRSDDEGAKRADGEIELCGNDVREVRAFVIEATARREKHVYRRGKSYGQQLAIVSCVDE